MIYKSMNEAVKSIQTSPPPIIFLSGRSASGKTTFSKMLEEIGYQVLELDEVIGKNVVEHFNIQDSKEAFIKIYKGLASDEWTNYFINEVRAHIAKYYGQTPLLIEGAISNVNILKNIFRDKFENFTFIYLYPTDIERYKQRIEKRFIKDIEENTTSLPIWPVPIEILNEYSKTKFSSKLLTDYLNKVSNEIYQGAKDRFHYFKDNGFEDITTIEV